MTASTRFGLTCLSVLVAALAGCSRPKPAVVQTGPPEVVVEPAAQRMVTDYEDFTGRTRASKAVDIKTQVTAELKSIGFSDGKDVTAGQPLFTLDQTFFLADVERAKADVERAKADVERARSEIERAKATEAEAVKEYQLNKNAFGGANQLELVKSEGAMRVAVAAVKAADSSLRVAEAAVRVAERQQAAAQNYVDYTVIKAPFAGQIGRRLVDVGNRVKQDDTVLARLLQLDPLDVDFDLDDRTLLRLNDLLAAERTSAGAAAGGWRCLGGSTQVREKVRIGLPDRDDFSLDGTVTFIDNQLNTGTSTIQVRAEVANPSGALKPGLFVRVRVWIGEPRPTVLVREEAIAIDQQLKVVYVVNGEDKVEARKVRPGQQVGAFRVVEPLPEDAKSGVRPGERVIVAGIQRVQHGTKVTPKLAK